jgi:hypothetical protein
MQAASRRKAILTEGFVNSFVVGVEIVSSTPILVIGIGLNHTETVGILLGRETAANLREALGKLSREPHFGNINSSGVLARRAEIFRAREELHGRKIENIYHAWKMKVAVRAVGAVLTIKTEAGEEVGLTLDLAIIHELLDAINSAIPIMDGKYHGANILQ